MNGRHRSCSSHYEYCTCASLHAVLQASQKKLRRALLFGTEVTRYIPNFQAVPPESPNPPKTEHRKWKNGSTENGAFCFLFMLARRSCHWGPIIALSLVTIVTTSSTYCLFQLSVLPKVVVFKTVHNVVCYTWIALILKNFFQVCTCTLCVLRVYLAHSVLGTLSQVKE